MHNSHLFRLKYLRATSNTGYRCKIITYDLKHRFNGKPLTRIINRKYDCESITEEIQKAMELCGLKIIAFNGFSPDSDYLVADWNYEAVCKFFGIPEEC